MDQTLIVGLYTKDFALLNKITNKIKDKKIKLRHLDNLSSVGNDFQVLISKKRIKDCKIPQIQPDNLDILELKIRCKLYDCSDLVIGIDPGGMIGLSAIGAGRILFIDTYDKPSELALIVKSMHLEIGVKTIKIGSGALKEYSGIIQLVNEQNSGSGSHTEAATRIALRQGEYNLDKKYQPKDGEISWIQKESRRLSKGLVTIDKELAHEILIGEKTMDEAIKIYTKKMKI